MVVKVTDTVSQMAWYQKFLKPSAIMTSGRVIVIGGPF